MGYYMKSVASKLHLAADRKGAAQEAIRQWTTDPETGLVFGDLRWVDLDELCEATSLEEQLLAFRWRAQVDEEGNVAGLQFPYGKSGEDEELLGVLAPFIEAGSWIEMVGEDGEHWRWTFDGLHCEQEVTYKGGKSDSHD